MKIKLLLISILSIIGLFSCSGNPDDLLNDDYLNLIKDNTAPALLAPMKNSISKSLDVEFIWEGKASATNYTI